MAGYEEANRLKVENAKLRDALTRAVIILRGQWWISNTSAAVIALAESLIDHETHRS